MTKIELVEFITELTDHMLIDLDGEFAAGFLAKKKAAIELIDSFHPAIPVTGPVTIQVPQETREIMLDEANAGLNPKVTFSEDMDEMRRVAENARSTSMCRIRNALQQILHPAPAPFVS